MATKTGLGEYSRLLLLALDSQNSRQGAKAQRDAITPRLRYSTVSSPSFVSGVERDQNNRGASLLEVLAAIFIITTILAIVSPMLFLVAASRVHTRDVEQAMDLARSEIELIQARMTRGVPVADLADEGTLLPPELASGEVASGKVQDASAPTSVVSDRSSATTTAAFRVDVDGDGNDDFIVQTFRDAGATFGSGLSKGEFAIFRMGVRVYSIAAQDNLAGSTGETELASLQFGRGLEDRTTRPLAALYTEISRSDLAVSLEGYEEYLKPPTPPPTP